MKRLNQQGAAAILSVVIFSIIITVVVTAYLRSAINGQAEATTFDFSTRAYYAAESGIQDALRSISANPDGATSKEDCSTFVPSGDGKLDATGALSYTCQLIDTTPSSIEFRVAQDTNGMARLLPAVMTDLGDTGDPYDLVIRWSSKQDAEASNFRARKSGDSFFPRQSEWKEDGHSLHPALRTSLITFPLNGPVTSSNLKQNVVFLNPIYDGAGEMAINSLNPNG